MEIVKLKPEHQEILQLLNAGKSLKEIAAIRNVEYDAVRKAVERLRKRLGCDNDFQLGRLYAEKLAA